MDMAPFRRALCTPVRRVSIPLGHPPCRASNGPALVERHANETVEGQNTMLCQTKDLQDRAIVGSDGAIGGIRDFYFDGEA